MMTQKKKNLADECHQNRLENKIDESIAPTKSMLNKKREFNNGIDNSLKWIRNGMCTGNYLGTLDAIT